MQHQATHNERIQAILADPAVAQSKLLIIYAMWHHAEMP
jgi:hypothetical protein